MASQDTSSLRITDLTLTDSLAYKHLSYYTYRTPEMRRARLTHSFIYLLCRSKSAWLSDAEAYVCVCVCIPAALDAPSVLLDIARGLRYLHSMNIVHGGVCCHTMHTKQIHH